jgi:hypothetical protein
MTKVNDAASADGSTPWFKIKDIGPKFPYVELYSASG